MQLNICSWTISWNIEVILVSIDFDTHVICSLFICSGGLSVCTINLKSGFDDLKKGKHNLLLFIRRLRFVLSCFCFVFFPIFTWFLHTDTCILKFKFKLEIYIQPIIHHLAETIPIFSQEFCIKVPTILLFRGRGAEIICSSSLNREKNILIPTKHNIPLLSCKQSAYTYIQT